MISKPSFVIWLALRLLPAVISGQNKRGEILQLGGGYIRDIRGTDNGLPQSSVTAIVQTRDGYLWLGTSGGLVRFDGVKFTVFDVGNAEGLKSNRSAACRCDLDVRQRT